MLLVLGAIIGAIAGAFLGLLVAILIQPLVEDDARKLLVRLLGVSSVKTTISLSGEWNSVWAKEGEELTRQYEMKGIKITNYGNRLAGYFTWHNRTYKFSANRVTDEFLSGTYEDVQKGRVWHGVFQ